MPIPALIIDGAAPYGSVSLTFTGSGVTVIADNFDFQQPYTKAEDRTITGAPNRARWTKERGTGTAVLQSPTGTSGRCKPGDTFAVLFDDNYASMTFVVTGVPFSMSNEPGEIRKYTISFEQVISAITTVA